MSDLVALEADDERRNEATGFIARLARVTSGARMFERLRDMVDDALVLDTHSPGMATPVCEAAEALDRAVALARADALSMRRSLWEALSPSERQDRLDTLSERLDRARRRGTDGDTSEAGGEPGRIAELLSARSEEHAAIQSSPTGACVRREPALIEG